MGNLARSVKHPGRPRRSRVLAIGDRGAVWSSTRHRRTHPGEVRQHDEVDPDPDRRRRRGAGDLLRQVPPRRGGLDRSPSSPPSGGPSCRSSTTSSRASTPTPRSPATGSTPTSGSTSATRRRSTPWSCPGGRAPEYLRNRPKAVAIVRHFVEAGKPIAANCHGPLLLFAAGYGAGQDVDLLPRARARTSGPRAGSSSTARSSSPGPVVTVRGWPDNGPWMREFVKLLKQDG